MQTMWVRAPPLQSNFHGSVAQTAEHLIANSYHLPNHWAACCWLPLLTERLRVRVPSLPKMGWSSNGKTLLLQSRNAGSTPAHSTSKSNPCSSMERAFPCEGRGCRFDPCQGYAHFQNPLWLVSHQPSKVNHLGE